MHRKEPSSRWVNDHRKVKEWSVRQLTGLIWRKVEFRNGPLRIPDEYSGSM
jgi:hypothetical protein